MIVKLALSVIAIVATACLLVGGNRLAEQRAERFRRIEDFPALSDESGVYMVEWHGIRCLHVRGTSTEAIDCDWSQYDGND